MYSQQFIESGILESYLLGLTSEKENKEVLAFSVESAEATNYVYRLENEIEAYLMSGAVPPPPSIRDVLEARINKNELQYNAASRNSGKQSSASGKTTPKEQFLEIEVNETQIRVHKYWRPAFIAIFILSKVFLILALYYFFKSNSLEQEVERLKIENTTRR